MHDPSKPFKALADSNRLRILNLLGEKPLCVCEITSVLGLAVSTISKHLSILRDAGFIDDHKDGKWVDYSLSTGADSPMIKDLLALMRRSIFKEAPFNADRKKALKADRRVLCGSKSSPNPTKYS
jgi:ArsR family transcriptional regulator